jgi:hypothetical protein
MSRELFIVSYKVKVISDLKGDVVCCIIFFTSLVRVLFDFSCTYLAESTRVLKFSVVKIRVKRGCRIDYSFTFTKRCILVKLLYIVVLKIIEISLPIISC